jgi:hypothetical protein
MHDAQLDRHPAASGNRVWWIWESETTGEIWSWKGDSPVGVGRIEMDMDAALSVLESDGVLRLGQDPDLVERTLERYDDWWRDLSLGVGYFWYRAP